jgi:hypothetical protein
MTGEGMQPNVITGLELILYQKSDKVPKLRRIATPVS